MFISERLLSFGKINYSVEKDRRHKREEEQRSQRPTGVSPLEQPACKVSHLRFPPLCELVWGYSRCSNWRAGANRGEQKSDLGSPPLPNSPNPLQAKFIFHPSSSGFKLWAVAIVLLTLSSGCASNKTQELTAKTTLQQRSTEIAATTPVDVERLQQLEDQLYAQLQVLIARAQGAREDGYVYTIDLSHILAYAAMKKDLRLYAPLRDFAVRNLIVDREDDPYTQGFVIWRYREGTPPDASGTTEALRLAESLWLGSQAFGNNSDRDRAILILNGYARHAQIDHKVWLIRNYFNLQTRAFATNSFLVGYDPDLLQDVGRATGEEQMQEVAQKSYSMVRQAVTPAGLLYDIVQPEVLTLVPELKHLVIFSPNDVIKLSNTCTVAERALGAPEVGQKVIDFALQRLPQLNNYYYGRVGEAVTQQTAEVATYACLVRLATKLKDDKARNAFLGPLMKHAQAITQNTEAFSLYTLGEALLAIQVVLQQPGIQENKAESLTLKVARLQVSSLAY